MGKPITIHCNRTIGWQDQRCEQMRCGLEELGFDVGVTDSRERIDDAPAVLFGTTFFKAVEEVPGDWLLVDRACYGDPDFVRLGWNGHGRSADYRVGEEWKTGARVKSHGICLRNWQPRGWRVVLCGDYGHTTPFHAAADATHFRPHPAAAEGRYETDLPILQGDLTEIDHCIVGMSSVSAELLMRGIRVKIADPNNMLAGWPEGTPREEMFAWLAHTQWTWKEIENGGAIAHLFD